MNKTAVRKSLLQKVDQERDRQIGIFGIQHHSNGKWTMILMEKIGEACAEFDQGRPESAKTELIEAAAVVIAWLEDLWCPKGAE